MRPLAMSVAVTRWVVRPDTGEHRRVEHWGARILLRWRAGRPTRPRLARPADPMGLAVALRILKVRERHDSQRITEVPCDLNRDSLGKLREHSLFRLGRFGTTGDEHAQIAQQIERLQGPSAGVWASRPEMRRVVLVDAFPK